MKMPEFVQKLLRRRVPQIMLAYCGGSLALIQFVGFLADSYDLPKALLNSTIVVCVSLLPSAFLLAYNHGAPGKDPWHLAERIGVPFNLMLAFGLLLYTFLYTGKTEAKIETVVITDAAGVEQERLVPNAKYRRKLALYFWANDSGDESLDWLRYGFPLMLESDLDQNRFIATVTPFDDALHTRLRRAGYEDGLAVPVALQQEIADDLGRAAFVNGRFDHDGTKLTVRLALYDTETAERRFEHTAEGEDPAALVDELTLALKADLEVEEIEGLGRDLPVHEQLSASTEALEAWVEGKVVRELANDFPAAIGHWQRAVAADESFALAHRHIASSYFRLGRREEAKVALREVQKHKYRLTERDQFMLRAALAEVDSDFDKAIKSFETLTKLYPDDVTALSSLARLQSGYNKIDDAVVTYERILEVDPSEDWALKEVGDLEVARRDYAAALTAYRRYAAAHPDESEIQYSIAQLQRAQGDLSAARETIEEASLLAGDPIKPALELAGIDLALGDVEAAGRRLEKVAAEASTPEDLAQVLGAQINFRMRCGRIEGALELLAPLREAQRQFLPPIQVTIGHGFTLPALHGLAGREAEGEAWIAETVKELGPPLDTFGHLFHLQLYASSDNAEGIESHLEAGEQAIRAFVPRDDMLALLHLWRGQALELRDQPAAAAVAFRSAVEGYEASTITVANVELRAKILHYLARASLDAGDAAAAAESLKETLQIIPAYPEGKFEMARLEQSRGNLAAARKHLATALEVWAEADPGFRPVIEARALAQELGS